MNYGKPPQDYVVGLVSYSQEACHSHHCWILVLILSTVYTLKELLQLAASFFFCAINVALGFCEIPPISGRHFRWLPPYRYDRIQSVNQERIIVHINNRESLLNIASCWLLSNRGLLVLGTDQPVPLLLGFVGSWASSSANQNVRSSARSSSLFA